MVIFCKRGGALRPHCPYGLIEVCTAFTARIATTGISTLFSSLTWILVATILILIVLDVAAVAAGYALQHFAILVQTGNLD